MFFVILYMDQIGPTAIFIWDFLFRHQRPVLNNSTILINSKFLSKPWPRIGWRPFPDQGFLAGQQNWYFSTDTKQFVWLSDQQEPIDFTNHYVCSACPVASLAIAALFFSSFWRTGKLIGIGQKHSRSMGTKYLRNYKFYCLLLHLTILQWHYIH